jgi:hypothetical protein
LSTVYSLSPITRKTTIAVIISAFLSMLSAIALAQSNPSSEYEVKATFILNFTKFVEWPPSAFDSADAPFIIVILGYDPFGPFLDKTVAGEKVKGHPIVVQRYQMLKEVERSHLIFINIGEAEDMNETIASIPSKVLTVSDSPEFNADGGMIRFATLADKTKLIVNIAAVKAAELVISSKLLNVAEIFEK